jgi:hypothetical protein
MTWLEFFAEPLGVAQRHSGQGVWCLHCGSDRCSGWAPSQMVRKMGSLDSRLPSTTQPRSSGRQLGLNENVETAGARILPCLRVLTSHYDLAQAESRVMIEWLIGDRSNDVRFALRRLLWSDAVKSNFSIIVIDCPPTLQPGPIRARVTMDSRYDRVPVGGRVNQSVTATG